MKLCTLSSSVLVLWMCTRIADGQVPRCLLSRLPCPIRPGLPTAGINQYAIYRSRIRQGISGFLECRLRGRGAIIRNILTLGTDEVRLLYSPGFQLIPRQNYANQMLIIYNVRCNDDERIYFNITWQDIQPRNCGDPPVCADYIQVIRSGGFRATESCGTDAGDNAHQLAGQEITVLFRTSEVDRFPGFEMNVVCYRPDERDLPGCTRVESDDVATSENDTVSGGEGTSSRNRRELQDYDSIPTPAEKHVLMELMQSLQFSPSDDVMSDYPTEDLNLGNLGRKKRQTMTVADSRAFDATAVRTAIMNENACNPVLRALARSVLTVNMRINATRVDQIRRELEMVTTQPPTMPETTPMETDPTSPLVTTQLPTMPEPTPTPETDPTPPLVTTQLPTMPEPMPTPETDPTPQVVTTQLPTMHRCTRVEGDNVTVSENRQDLQEIVIIATPAEKLVLMELIQSLQLFDYPTVDAAAVQTAIVSENTCNPVLRALAREVLTVNMRIDADRVRQIREELQMQMVTTQPPTMPGTDVPTESWNPDISVECEATTIGIIKFVDQLFYPNVSGSIRKLSVWINPDLNHEIMYRVKIYHSLMPRTNLIASSNNVTLGSFSPSTPAQFYDFTFPSNVNLIQGDGYIWNLERLSEYGGGIARCADTIQGYAFLRGRLGYIPQTSYDYSFKLYITV